MGQGFKRVDTVARFVYREGVGQEPGSPARGLFVCFQVTPASGQPRPSDFTLGFCDAEGVLRLLPPDINHWAYAVPGASLTGKVPGSVLASPVTYSVCFLAHPSPEYARAALAHLHAGKGPDGTGTWVDGFRPRDMTPEATKQGLTFVLPGEPSAYVPGGPAAYGGWLLYRHMPYGDLPAVQQQTRALATKLARLRYPVGLAGKAAPEPYPVRGEHGGEFDTAVQAALCRFQRDVAEGKAFALSPLGLGLAAQEHERARGWCFLHGEETREAPRAQLEPNGTVDDATADMLEQWLAAQLRAPGVTLVCDDVPLGKRAPGKTQNHAEPGLWWRFWALEALCNALGGIYPPQVGGTHRTIAAAATGQIAKSNHKVGRALDMPMAGFAEPSDKMPVAFEAHARDREGPRWLVYLHSQLDPFGEEPAVLVQTLKGALQTARTMLWQRIEAVLSGRLVPESEQVLRDFEALAERLLQLAGQADGSATALAREYFRERVQRFQWQAGQADIGDAMPAISAVDDGLAQGLKLPARTFLNLTRLAHQLGLESIGTQSGYAPSPSAAKTTEITPGKAPGATQKAVALDELAEGIQAALAMGMPVTVKSGKTVHTLDASRFDLEAIRNWMTRPSDSPDVLKRPAAKPAMEYAEGGVDLTIQVQVDEGRAKQDQLDFLESRSDIRVKVMEIGAGVVTDRLVPGVTETVVFVREQISTARPASGSNERRVRLRLVTGVDELTDDPGVYTYSVPALAAPAKMEWWHLELSARGLWHDLANDVGLSAAVLAAPQVPQATSSGPLWQGGLGYAADRNVRPRASDPGNEPPAFLEIP